MAHDTQRAFCEMVKNVFPEKFHNVSVCDIGSLDVNGNNHFLFSQYQYVGIDVGHGRNVTYVGAGHTYRPFKDIKHDVVISTECFEHDMHWKLTLKNIVTNLLKSGGLFLFTCATDGRAEHGTRRSRPDDSPLTVGGDSDWSDYYMNLNEGHIREAIDVDGLFKAYHFYTNMETYDLYFWGILK